MTKIMFKTSSGLEIFLRNVDFVDLWTETKACFCHQFVKNKNIYIINTNKMIMHRFEGRITHSAGARTLSGLSMGKLVAVAIANMNISTTLNTRLCLEIFTI